MEMKQQMKSKQLRNGSDQINQICMKGDWLACVTQEGWVYVWNLNEFHLNAVVLSNRYEGIEDCSSWSVDIYENLLSVGSNAKIISLWNLSRLDCLYLNSCKKEWQQMDEQMNQLQHGPEKYSLLSDCEYETFPKRYQMMGNQHNVPCVKFSLDGLKLASVSIDQYLRLFSVESGQMMKKVDIGGWGWGIEWLADGLLAVSLAKLVKLYGVKDLREWDIFRNVGAHSFGNHSRYSILRYADPLLMAVSQHTPDVHFFVVRNGQLVQMNVMQVDQSQHLVGGSLMRCGQNRYLCGLVTLSNDFMLWWIEVSGDCNEIFNIQL